MDTDHSFGNQHETEVIHEIAAMEDHRDVVIQTADGPLFIPAEFADFRYSRPVYSSGFSSATLPPAVEDFVGVGGEGHTSLVFREQAFGEGDTVEVEAEVRRRESTGAGVVGGYRDATMRAAWEVVGRAKIHDLVFEETGMSHLQRHPAWRLLAFGIVIVTVAFLLSWLSWT